jgi:hypothetical protein
VPPSPRPRRAAPSSMTRPTRPIPSTWPAAPTANRR